MFSRMEEEKKTPSVRTLFYVSFLWMRRRKNSFGCQIIFCLLSMVKEEKKLILLEHYFLYDFYDAGAKKSHSVIKLFFWSSLWWTKRKNSFGYNIIFSLLSIMEQEKKLILLQLSFLYVVYDEGIEKTRSVVSLFFVSSLSWTEKKIHFVITLFFVCFLWPSNRKNSFCCNIISCMLSMLQQEKNLMLLQHCFFYVVYDGAREKTHSLTTLFFLCYLWWSKRKNSFCCNIIFCILSLMEQEKKAILLKHYFLYVF